MDNNDDNDTDEEKELELDDVLEDIKTNIMNFWR